MKHVVDADRLLKRLREQIVVFEDMRKGEFQQGCVAGVQAAMFDVESLMMEDK